MRALADELSRGAAARREELIDLVRTLASVDAPSGSGPDALAAAADVVAGCLRLPGARLSRIPGTQGDLLELELGPQSSDRTLVLGHYDTVWPAGTAAQRPFKLDGDVITGPGVFDMRGGLAVAICALRLLGPQRLPLRTTVLVTPDEETGSAGSQRRIVELALDSRWVLVLEPPLAGGRVKTARSGWAVYRLKIAGRAAHAGLEPERGVSAIDELCDVLAHVRGLARAPLGTTINVGVIGGGTAVNTVAESAHALIDVRARSVAEMQRIDDALGALRPIRAGASLSVQALHSRPAMERSRAIARAFAHARSLASLLGIKLAEGRAGGTSDANLIAHRGVALLDGLGPEGGGAHSEDEHILVSSLVQRAALIAMLLANPPEPQPAVDARSCGRPPSP
ncbi:MAG TPA: M20/M25/M40 family metallo-hydrolase [Solirubrobacteraceae bacterium]|nr:M20/M25/M40 family metallo-hydrolase [Solirubrobacteraceae bacterium]